MSRLRKNADASGIEKIEALENGKYKVYFSFSDVPVEMNRSYLDTLLAEKEDHNHN